MENMTFQFTCLLFLALGMLLCSQAQCLDGECEIPTRKSGDEVGQVADDVTQDMHMELLQRDLKLSNREGPPPIKPKSGVFVKPWICGTKPKAYQSTTASDNSWTAFQVLNLSTGVYATNFSVNLNAIAPDKIRSMNSCAINPKDHILYCSMEVYNKGSFLVRIDQTNTIGYVTKLLGWRYAATFDDDDNYYVSGENQLTVLKDVSKIVALPSYNGLNNVGETPVKLEINGQNMTNYELGADYGITYANWEGNGNNTYLVSIDNTDLLIVRVSPGPYKLWTLSGTNLPTGAPGTPRVWGAAWKWGKNGDLYFAADDGLGLWKLLGNTVNLNSGKANFTKIALANPTDWNDGFTCGDFFPDHYVPKRISCEYDLYQSTTVGKVSSTTSKTYIRHIVKMGAAETEVDFELESSGLLSINACAVNPLDQQLYCNAQMANGQRIARVGNGTMAFIQQAPAGYAFAGYFDPKGGYWVYATDGLYLVSGLNEEDSYSDYTLYAVASNTKWTSYTQFGTQQFKAAHPSYTQGAVGADFIAVEEKGKTYLVSIVESADNSVSVVDITNAPNEEPNLVAGPDGAVFFKSEGLPEPFPGNTTNTWGSAWKTSDKAADGAKMLFSRDYGGELYELTSLNTATKTATFELYSKAEDAAWHDGFTCIDNITGIDTGKIVR